MARAARLWAPIGVRPTATIFFVAILGTETDDLSDSDYAHMRKVAGYVRRHLAQEPANIATSRWRYSLMNWGHDPLK